MRFIHTADLHLSAPIVGSSARTALRRGGLQVLEQIIRYAESNGIPHMVIAGDLFDTPTPSSAILGAVRAMFEQTSLRIWMVAGNHDPLTDGGYLGVDWSENVHIFGKTPECVATSDGVFAGVSFYEGMNQHPLVGLRVNSLCSVGIFHGSLRDSSPAYRIDETALAESGLGYAALGHIHKTSEPVYVGKTLVGTCGSPLSHGFDELGERSFFEVEVNEGGAVWKRVVTDSIRFYEEKIEIDETMSAADVLGKLMNSASRYKERDIFRFRLVGQTALAMPTALEEYPALVEIIDETTLSADVEKLASEQSLRGFFVSEMLEKLAAAPLEERHKFEAALRLGLEAFE
ncbi:MAG: metallophosphoesterase [Clostridia bacterium]|nr:metallophosphoesterase [Clostridia bacterium]